MPSIVCQSLLLRLLSQALSSHCGLGPAACWPSSHEVEAQSRDGEWHCLPQPWEVTLASFNFILFLLSSPQVLIFKDLIWTRQIVSRFTLMFWYHTWRTSVALEKCSKNPCRFSKELQIAKNLKAIRDLTFFLEPGCQHHFYLLWILSGCCFCISFSDCNVKCRDNFQSRKWHLGFAHPSVTFNPSMAT